MFLVGDVLVEVAEAVHGHLAHLAADADGVALLLDAEHLRDGAAARQVPRPQVQPRVPVPGAQTLARRRVRHGLTLLLGSALCKSSTLNTHTSYGIWRHGGHNGM